MRRWIFIATLAAGIIAGINARAQVQMTLAKSGSDVVVTWSGGTGPFAVIRSDSPSFTTRTVALSADATSPYTDAGAAADGAMRHFYAVVEPSSAPAIAVDSPAAGFSAQAPCLCVTGTSSGATVIYCNTVEAVGTDSWSACPDNTGVPLAVQQDPKRGGGVAVIASAKDAAGNWSYIVIVGNYAGTITDKVPCRARGRGE